MSSSQGKEEITRGSLKVMEGVRAAGGGRTDSLRSLVWYSQKAVNSTIPKIDGVSMVRIYVRILTLLK